MTPLLAVQDLSRTFGGHQVVQGLTFDVGAGERLALVGPNGSGKSTVLRCLAGTLTPSGGKVMIVGHPAGSRFARSVVGTSLSQERSFYLRLSGRANLHFFARVRGATRGEAKASVDAIERELELTEILNERVDRCSTGMVQQLGFARALVGDARLLLLDEPTRSLDREAVTRLWGALDRRADVGIVLATHSESDVAQCGNRLALGT
jgi:ABC-type multidrug transport system ATPase subunit